MLLTYLRLGLVRSFSLLDDDESDEELLDLELELEEDEDDDLEPLEELLSEEL